LVFELYLPYYCSTSEEIKENSNYPKKLLE